MAIDLAIRSAAGVIMLDTHQLVDVDTFTYTVAGHPGSCNGNTNGGVYIRD